jgi:hypothetical protein
MSWRGLLRGPSFDWYGKGRLMRRLLLRVWKFAAAAAVAATVGLHAAMAQPCDLSDIAGDGAFCGDATTGPRECTDAEWEEVCRRYGRGSPRAQARPAEECYTWEPLRGGRWYIQCASPPRYTLHCYVCPAQRISRACTRINDANQCARVQ